MGRVRVPSAWIALALVVVGSASGGTAAEAQPLPPNLVLVILDDVGVELLGAYNRDGTEVVGPTPPEHTVTPNIDALAEAGLLFRNAWAAPLCRPTRAALLTGMFGLHNGSINNDSFGFAALATLPERLAAAPVPYPTRAAIGKWHLSTYSPYAEDDDRTPSALGFTTYAGDPFLSGYAGYPWAVDPPPIPAALDFPAEYRTTKDLAEAVAFVEATPEAPWFLWLALKAGHKPWLEAETPPDPASPCNVHAHEATRVRCRQLEIFDEGFGALLAALESNDPGLANTTVILLGDNGSPAEGGPRPEPIPGRVNRGAKASIYEGGVNVPLLVAGAGVAANDPDTIEETPALVHVADVFSTLLDLAGARGSEAAVDGISFASVLAGASEHRSCVFVDGNEFTPDWYPLHPGKHDVAVRDERYKLIRRAASEPGAHRYELYDLLADPGETTPLPLMGKAVKALLAELKGLDKNPLRSPCGLRKRKINCELGPEFLSTAFAIGIYRVRRRPRR